MRLHAWLVRNNVTVAKLADQLGIESASTVYRYIRGERVPTAGMIEKIGNITGGDVKREDFLRSKEWFEKRRGKEDDDDEA
jgi:transcriptional regulator with XRE-family HTH domain